MDKRILIKSEQRLSLHVNKSISMATRDISLHKKKKTLLSQDRFSLVRDYLSLFDFYLCTAPKQTNLYILKFEYP